MASSSIGSSERQASCTDVRQKRQPYQNRVNTSLLDKILLSRRCIMVVHVLTVSSKGQVVLPVSMRKAMEMESGSKLAAYATRGHHA